MDAVTRNGRDAGFTIAELLVSVSLLFIVLGMVFITVEGISTANATTERQSKIAREISTPLDIIDKVLSQNKALENGGAYLSDAYTISARSPVDPRTQRLTHHIFSAGTDGRLTETVYTQAAGSPSTTLLRTTVWSKSNANRTQGPLFTYLGPSGETTAPAVARSVIVKMWVKDGDRYVFGARQIFFRNR